MSPLTREKIIEEVGRVKGLPAYPGLVAEVEREFQRAEPSLEAVAASISKDPALSAAILRIANSVLIRGRSEISSIFQAILRLGIRETRKVLLGAAFVSQWPKTPGIDQRRFWRHALTVGMTANQLGRFVRREIQREIYDTAFTAGLLHDLGSLVLARTFPLPYAELLQELDQSEVSLDALETARWGIEHGEVGELLAVRWQLPTDLRAAISCHHRPWMAPVEHKALVSLIHLADFLSTCQGLDSGQGGGPEELDPTVWDTLGLELEQVEELFAGVTQQGDISQQWVAAIGPPGD